MIAWGSWYADVEGPNEITAILAIQGIAVPFLHNLSGKIVGTYHSYPFDVAR